MYENEGQKTIENPLDASKWLTEITAAEKNQEKWQEQARRIVLRYLDRREHADEKANRLNLFTTNTNILMSTLYARIPKPLVTREFEDETDDVARVASMIIERCLKVRMGDDFDCATRYVVQDRLVPGLGTMWMRYEAVTDMQMTEPVVDPMTGQVLEEAQEVEVLVDETIHTDYVFWEDIFWGPSRTWETIPWISRRIKMSKEDAVKRFGETIASGLNYETMSSSGVNNSGEAPKSTHKLATIFEIWCKRTRTVYWVSKGVNTILDKKSDPLNLKDFWPCPRFLHAMISTSNFMPRPDYLMAQDQYTELDEVNNRIVWIERAVKVVGIYDGNNTEIERIFTENIDNKLIPTRSFRDFAEKGGFKGAMDWLPIEAMVNALDKLRQIRQDLVMQIYEITGISDIMRGSSKASETLGAQQLKAQYASVKLQHLQMEVASFVQNALQIRAEIIQNIFDPESIKKLANVQYLHQEDQQHVDAAIELIKSGQMEYRIEVHADSMAVPEFNAERDGRMGFLRAIAEMMTAAAPILERDPSAGIAMLRVVQWGAASFRTGREIEGVLDQAIKGLEKSLQQPKQPQPDPKMLELQAKQQLQERQQAFDERMEQQRQFFDQRMSQVELSLNQQREQQKLEADTKGAIVEALIKAQTEVITAKIAAATKPAEGEGSKSSATETLQPVIDATQAMMQLTAGIAKAMTRPRKRIPKRGENGDIEYVEEVFDDEGGEAAPADLATSIRALAESLAKPRRRIPRRGRDGEIQYVDEIIGE